MPGRWPSGPRPWLRLCGSTASCRHPCASVRCAPGAIPAEGPLVELHPEYQVGTLGSVMRGLEVAVVETADVVADADPGVGERGEADAGAESPGVGVLAPGVQDAGTQAEVDAAGQVEADRER